MTAKGQRAAGSFSISPKCRLPFEQFPQRADNIYAEISAVSH